MDYMRKTEGVKDVTEAYAAFIEKCDELHINLTVEEKRELNKKIRHLHKTRKETFLAMSFEEVVAELNGSINSINDYFMAQQVADLSSAKQAASEEEEGTLTEELSEAVPSLEPVEVSGDTVSSDTLIVPVEVQTTSDEAPLRSSEVLNTGELKKESEVPKNTKQNKSLEKLDIIQGMRSGRKVDRQRKNEITKEIRLLKVQRDTRTRNICMMAEDVAILTSIMDYAESKDGNEKQFLDNDMDTWIGVLHAAVECLIQKMSEEGRTHYLDAIVKGLEAEKKRRAAIDLQIEKLMEERAGL